MRATTKELAQLPHKTESRIVANNTDRLNYILKNLHQKSPIVTDRRPPRQPKARAKHWDFTIHFSQKSTPHCLREIRTTWAKPTTAPNQSPITTYHNLPHRPQPELFDRTHQIAQIHQWLQDPHPYLIAIEGMGGIGKTALALEIAHHYLNHEPQFTAIIFISVPTQPTTTHGLQDILRTISHTLTKLYDLPTEANDQIQHIYRLLQSQPTLMVIDNIESLAQHSPLLKFLQAIPASTQAILTSREHIGLAQTIHLTPLPTTTVTTHLTKEFKRREINLPSPKIAAIATAIAGSPFAMASMIRNIAANYHSNEPLQLNLRSSIADVNAACFHSSLRSLQADPQTPALTTLFTLSLFFYPVSTTTLAHITHLSLPDLRKSLARLHELYLIDYPDCPPDPEIVPTLHSLVHSYVTTQLAHQPQLAQQIRHQWLQYYRSFAATALNPNNYWLEWQDFSPLLADWQNLRTAVNWCLTNNRYPDVSHFFQCLSTLAILTGQWSERQSWNDYLLAESYQRQDYSTQAEATFQAGLTLTFINEADPHNTALSLVQEAWQQRWQYPSDRQFNIALLLVILYLRKTTHGDRDYSAKVREFMHQAQEIASQHPAVTHYQCQLSYCAAELDYIQNRPDQALAKYRQTLSLAQLIGYQRCIAYCNGRMAKIFLDLQEFSPAQQHLDIALDQSQKYHDQRSIAFCYAYQAQIAAHQQQPTQDLHQKAINIFQALGMYREANLLSQSS